MLQEFLAEFSKEYAVRQLRGKRLPPLGNRTPLEFLIAFLDGLGKENLEFAVREGITLWDLMPQEWKGRARQDNSFWSRFARSFDAEEAGKLLYEAIVQERPEYAEILSQDWLAEAVRAYQGGQ